LASLFTRPQSITFVLGVYVKDKIYSSKVTWPQHLKEGIPEAAVTKKIRRAHMAKAELRLVWMYAELQTKLMPK
jgi:hypothetical protein